MFTCMQPFAKKIESNIHYLPCGKCPYCLKRRSNSWLFRLMEEEKKSSSSYFITLTYDNDNIPVNDYGEMILNKKDLQTFMKRLRKLNIQNLKYYACGEYGGITKRPHYHMILFNAQKETIERAWSKDGKKIGHVHFGKVRENSIVYTLKYMNKSINWNKEDTRTKHFSLMSKGLGIGYLTDNMRKWHKNDVENRVYCNLLDGKKIAMPRYYKEKIYSNDEKGIIKSCFTEKVRKHHEELEDYSKAIQMSLTLKARESAIKREFEKMKIDYNNRKN